MNDKLKAALEFLGTRYLLHPSNRVQKRVVDEGEVSITTNWIRMSDRQPTVDDADESSTVWVYDCVFKSVSSAHFYQAHSAPYYTHWMPKNKRPAPPAPEENKT